MVIPSSIKIRTISELKSEKTLLKPFIKEQILKEIATHGRKGSYSIDTITKVWLYAIRLVQHKMNTGGGDIDFNNPVIPFPADLNNNEEAKTYLKIILPGGVNSQASYQKYLENICLHKNTFFSNRKINLGFGFDEITRQENYTETARSLITEIKQLKSTILASPIESTIPASPFCSLMGGDQGIIIREFLNADDIDHLEAVVGRQGLPFIELKKLANIARPYLISDYHADKLPPSHVIDAFNTNKYLKNPDLLLTAAKEGNIDLIRVFIFAKADLNFRRRIQPPCFNNNMKITSYKHYNSAGPTYTSTNESWKVQFPTAFSCALECKQSRVAKLLYLAGADIDLKGEYIVGQYSKLEEDKNKWEWSERPSFSSIVLIDLTLIREMSRSLKTTHWDSIILDAIRRKYLDILNFYMEQVPDNLKQSRFLNLFKKILKSMTPSSETEITSLKWAIEYNQAKNLLTQVQLYHLCIQIIANMPVPGCIRKYDIASELCLDLKLLLNHTMQFIDDKNDFYKSLITYSSKCDKESIALFLIQKVNIENIKWLDNPESIFIDSSENAHLYCPSSHCSKILEQAALQKQHKLLKFLLEKWFWSSELITSAKVRVQDDIKKISNYSASLNRDTMASHNLTICILEELDLEKKQHVLLPSNFP